MASPYLETLRPDEHRALIDTLLRRQSGRCFVCDQPIDPMAHPGAVRVDLVQPLDAGGVDEPGNCAVLHAGCSRSRQHSDLEIARALALFGRIRETPADIWSTAAPGSPPEPAPANGTPGGISLEADNDTAATPAALSAGPEAAPARGEPVRVVQLGSTAAPGDLLGGSQSERGSAATAPPSESFGRTIAFTALGAAIPGTGYLAAGRRRLGTFVLAVAVAALVAFALFVTMGDPKGTAVEVASRPQLLLLGGVGALAVAALWIVVIVTSHRMILPKRATTWQRRTATGLVVLLSLGVLLPALLIARYALATKDLIDNVFDSAPVAGDTPLTRAPIDRSDPWKDTPRLNVLLLGGDSERVAATDGMGGGFLTTTMIVASIDTATGDTVLISLPHDLQNAPIPADNPLAALYPTGYTCSPDPRACLLNGVYREAEAHADLFPDVAEPGIATVRDVVAEITGIPLDYHLFVDLQGFASLVDAVGGVELDVGPVPVPVATSSGGAGPLSESGVETIPAGRQHLDGRQAVAFARERPLSTGTAAPASALENRVNRQSAVLSALLAAADPAAVVTNYLVLSTAAQDTLSTDVPIELLPALVDLSELMRNQELDVLPLPTEALVPAAPNYGLIRETVAATLELPAG